MAERDRVLAALTGVGWHKAGALCRRGGLKARPTDGWASIDLEGKGGFTQRCFSQSTQRTQRVGFHAEHAEGSEKTWGTRLQGKPLK